jgi:hypothetical protein
VCTTDAITGPFQSRLHFVFGMVTGSNLDEVIRFFKLSNPSSRTMVLGLTQLLTEISIRNMSGGKARPARKADNLTAVSVYCP